ncbi:hypothetical protein H7I39_04430 [Mycobacterium doricum]|nr:hypothetical protein [Mycolicibacterium doricum]
MWYTVPPVSAGGQGACSTISSSFPHSRPRRGQSAVVAAVIATAATVSATASLNAVAGSS